MFPGENITDSAILSCSSRTVQPVEDKRGLPSLLHLELLDLGISHFCRKVVNW